MSTIKVRQRDTNVLVVYFAAVLLFLGLMPYFWWWTASNRWAQILCGVITGYLFYKNSDKLEKRNVGLVILFVLMAIIYTFRTTFTSLISNLPLVFIPFASKKFIREVYKAFSNIYCIIVGLALISWILYLMGMISPIGQITPLNTTDFDYCNKYPLFMITNSAVDLNMRVRFEGPFDEPGVIGTVSALMIFIQRFNFRDWKTYVLLLSGLFSLSLFFNVIFFGFGLLYIVFVKRKYWAPVIFLAGLFVFYNNTKDNELFEYEVWSRFEWDKTDKRFAGDDRSNYDAKKYYESKKWSSEFWWGLNNFEPYSKISRGDCSYRNVVMLNGMVFLLMYVLFFVFYAKKGKVDKKELYLFILIFIACIYQRPQLLSSSYLFIYTCLARASVYNLDQLRIRLKDNEKVFNSCNDSHLQTI